MENLSTYVAAILGRESTVAVSGRTVETSSWLDQGHEVSRETTEYRFDDEVVIRRTVERDTFPTGAACAECWITYEVIATGKADRAISPARKTFENECREAFWLAYHTA